MKLAFDKDAKTRNLSDKKLKQIASDYFKLNYKEFEKILNRNTRYEGEDFEVEYITEGKTSASTYFEQVIVACANSTSLKQLKASPGYAAGGEVQAVRAVFNYITKQLEGAS